MNTKQKQKGQNDETFISDHLMDHFATWFTVSVVSIDLIKLVIKKYREDHPDR
jgi:hypothetical protein